MDSYIRDETQKDLLAINDLIQDPLYLGVIKH
jgi:hypothetical protein